MTALNTKVLTASALPAIQSLDFTQLEMGCVSDYPSCGRKSTAHHCVTWGHNNAIDVEFSTASLEAPSVTAPNTKVLPLSTSPAHPASRSYISGGVVILMSHILSTPQALQAVALSLLSVSVVAEGAGTNACHISLHSHLVLIVLPPPAC